MWLYFRGIKLILEDKVMKRLSCLLVSMVVIASTACADNDKVTNNVNELPQVSRTFLNNYFNGKNISHIKIDKDFLLVDSYDVILTDGTTVEFDRSGEWKEVKSFQQNIPSALIPDFVQKYVDQNYPGQKILAVEREKREISVDLSNEIELTFNNEGFLIDIDN